MTTDELRKLTEGTAVTWDDTGDLGRVVIVRGACWIKWGDGQTTLDLDDWALKHVRVADSDDKRGI